MVELWNLAVLRKESLLPKKIQIAKKNTWIKGYLYCEQKKILELCKAKQLYCKNQINQTVINPKTPHKLLHL